MRLNNYTQFLDTSSFKIGFNFVLMDLKSDFSICSFLSFKENPGSIALHVATWLPFLARTKFVHGSPRTCVCGKKRLSWQQTFFMRVINLYEVRWFFSLLNQQWWKSAFPIISRRSPHYTSTKALYLCRRIHRGTSLQKSLISRNCREGWARNLWEDCISPRSNTPHVRECNGFNPRWWRHWRWCARQRASTLWKRQQTHAQTCDIMDGMWMECAMRTETPWATMWCTHMCNVNEKNHVWSVSVYTPPSVTVDRCRL